MVAEVFDVLQSSTLLIPEQNTQGTSFLNLLNSAQLHFEWGLLAQPACEANFLSSSLKSTVGHHCNTISSRKQKAIYQRIPLVPVLITDNLKNWTAQAACTKKCCFISVITNWIVCVFTQRYTSSLEAFKARLSRALSILGLWEASLPTAGGSEIDDF